MPSIAIWLPDDVKDRLDKYKEFCNVSLICRNAIERELDTQEALQKGTKKMSMVERLSLQAEDARENAKSEGKVDGIEYAKKHGEFDELMLFKNVNDGNKTWTDLGQECDLDDIVDPDGDRQSEPFYGAYTEGFVEGAAEAFNDALPEIENLR